MEQGNASGILSDYKVPLKFKGKCYSTAVKLAMLGFKYQHMQIQMNVGEMRMLLQMSVYIMEDTIKNISTREETGYVPIEDKMRPSHVRCHKEEKYKCYLRRCDLMENITSVSREIDKRTWMETIKTNLAY